MLCRHDHPSLRSLRKSLATGAMAAAALLIGSAALAAPGDMLSRPLKVEAAAEPAMAAGFGGQLGNIIHPVSFALRLGAMVSPRTKFVGGADATLNAFHIIPSLTTRIDVDAIVSANLGGVSTLVPLTIDQIYSKGLVAGNKIYGGFGIGPYFGSPTRFGGKIFFGGNVTGGIGGELSLHFAGYGDPLVVLQARIPLL